jgi:hypothetical protein
MKGKPIDDLVYECIFPKQRPGDPQNFYDFLRYQLLPEVRSETACFYGDFSNLKAQYPGLDYSYHRIVCALAGTRGTDDYSVLSIL